MPMSQEHATNPQYWSVTIVDLGEEGLCLRSPLVVMLATQEAQMIASWPEVDVSATGANAVEAIDRLKGVIVARYRALQQTDTTNSRQFWRYWRALRAIIEESNEESNPQQEEHLSPALVKLHPQTGLPYIECPHRADEMTPERVAEVLLQQEEGWHHEVG
jgi:hypothetical protein